MNESLIRFELPVAFSSSEAVKTAACAALQSTLCGVGVFSVCVVKEGKVTQMTFMKQQKTDVMLKNEQITCSGF